MRRGATLLLTIALSVLAVVPYVYAFPDYVSCFGVFTTGDCSGTSLSLCDGQLMGEVIQDGSGSFVTLSSTTVNQGDAVDITFSSSTVRLAFAPSGQFSGDTSCQSFEGTRLARTQGYGQMTWNAPIDDMGDIELIFVTTPTSFNPGNLQTVRYKETVTVMAVPSTSPTPKPTAPTESPTLQPTRNPGSAGARSEFNAKLLVASLVMSIVLVKLF